MPSYLPQLSLGTAALLVFAACAGFVMLRGIFRMLGATVVLALAAAAGFFIWQAAPALSARFFGKPVPLFNNGLPALAFVVVFYIARKITGFLMQPFASSGGGERPAFGSFGFFARLIFSLIPTGLLCLIGATFVRHAGSVAEVRAYADKALGMAVPPATRYFEQLKTSVSAVLPKQWLSYLDPSSDPTRVEIAKEVVSGRNWTPDPLTGQPVPRASPVDEKELEQLAHNKQYGELLRHPVLAKAAPIRRRPLTHPR